MSDRSTLPQWRSLTEAASQALANGDLAALIAVLDQRDELLSRVETETHTAEDRALLVHAEAELSARAESLKEIATQELRDVRAAREKLRVRDRTTRAPAITSQRV